MDTVSPFPDNGYDTAKVSPYQELLLVFMRLVAQYKIASRLCS